LEVKPEPAVKDERRGLVRDAIEGWIARLIDLSRRNNLIYFRPTQGTLELTDCDDEELDRLLHGKKLALSVLVTEEEEVAAAAKLQEIRRKALANREEKGLETLFFLRSEWLLGTLPTMGENPKPRSCSCLWRSKGGGRETRTSL
jgi:hypothetical protein